MPEICFAEKTFDNIRTMLQNPDNKWVQYVNRGLDELDPQVIKMTALNLGIPGSFRRNETDPYEP